MSNIMSIDTFIILVAGIYICHFIALGVYAQLSGSKPETKNSKKR